MKKSALLLISLLMLAFAACIPNDIPFPRIQANIITLDAKGQDGGTIIDSVSMTATIPFPEEANLSSVRITGYTLTPGAHIVDNPFGENVDLTSPLSVTLELYQSYTWKIIARQDIERYFEVEGQVGSTVIDVPARRVIVYVSNTQDINKIKIVKAKLGAKSASSSPSLAEGSVFDGSRPLHVAVTNYGTVEDWTVYVEIVEISLRTLSVDAWTCVAWINGVGEAGSELGAEYRLAGTEMWTKVPQSDITVDGGNFTARVAHLSPETAYQARVYSGGLTGEIIDFTTGTTLQMPNSNFEYWWLDKKIWCPWQEDGDPFWGTGNQGAATLGQSNSVPTDDTPSGSGWAAQLESRFVGIGKLGKLAAGNIFVGAYLRTVGTNGVLSFGRPFTQRPVKLRGMYKYKCVDISHYSDETAYMLGQPDTCSIYIALIDSPEPIEIRTAPADRSLFNPNADYVVAYGALNKGETIPDWTPFEINIDYRSTSRVPKYVVCAASASKWGDYFTGGSGSILYLDDLELIYDY